MIGYVQGSVKGIIRDTLVLDAGAVGYRVHVPTYTLAKTVDGDSLFLWTHFAVRENSQDLFGFETKEELRWFELLLTVSGIGPRSALAVMNSADINTLESAITRNEPSVLSRAVGVGKKTAEKIVLELKEKVEPKNGTETLSGSDGEVVEALIALGYSVREARDTARAIPKELEGVEARVREAIRLAAGSR